MAANESVTSTPPAAGPSGVTPLPPLVAQTSVVHDRVSPWVGRLDAILLVVVLAFAFLTASFAASNSDFFFQMGAGKLLAEGRARFGVDPFTSTTENVYWANHSWLFGVVAYLVYDAFPGHGTDDASAGGVILVVAKALLVTLLAWLLIATGRRRGQSLWIPAACAALAVLAMSTRLFLHSTTLSYVYLGLTLFLLRRPRRDAAAPDAPAKGDKANAAPAVPAGNPFKAFWAIPPLCILWVNTDGWFFLGPLTVALYLAGELIEQAQAHAADRDDRPLPGELKALGYVLVASVAVCFINPHHYHAFTLPPQLGLTGAGEKLHDDPQFRVLFVSPFEDFYYNKARVGLSAAGLAYFPLLLLSLLSFGLNYRSIRPWRVLVWLPFAVLSAFHARAIPFFAVVAGPILALNCLDFAARIAAADFTARRGWHVWRVGGRALCVAAGLALVVCTVPGWLQAQPYEKRRVAWGVHVEPSWKETGEKVALWRDRGLLPEGEGWFNTSPDVVNYMAYYCDGQRGFLDARLQLFDDALEDYLVVRKGLNAEEDDPAAKGPRPPEAPWRAVFTRRHVRFVILHNEPSQLVKPLSRMLGTPEEWTPLYADGDTFIFGWNDPRDKPPPQFAAMQLDYDREAFGPDVRPLRRPHAPATPHVREWYEALWEAEKPLSPAVNLAVFHDLYEDSRNARWELREQRRWRDTAVTAEFAVGLSMPFALFHPGSPIVGAHNSGLEPPSPAPNYLTVRQIQQSLADNPDDARAYLALGSAYFKLFWYTQERARSFSLAFPHPAVIRHTQIVTALNEALKLDPTLEAAHGLLAEHYTRCRANNLPNFYESNAPIHFLDVELKHREEQLRLSRTHGDPPKGLEDEVKRLKKEVERQLNLYEINAANKPVIQRALTALQAGLGETAQTILEKADAKELSVGPGSQAPGFILRVKLLLSLGRGDEVRDVLTEVRTRLTEEKKKPDWGMQQDLGVPTFEWFEVLTAAATGDYAAADKALAALEQQVRQSNEKRLPDLAARFGAQVLLTDEANLMSLKSSLLNQTREVAFQFLEQEADMKTLRGWLALEAGDVVLARQEFREVLEMSRSREPDLAGSLAVGATLPVAQGRRPGQTRMLGLHALPLAATGERWLEDASR